MDSHIILKSCLQNCRVMAEEPQAFQSNSSAEDPLLWETSVPQEPACTEEPQPALPPTEGIWGSPQTAADTRPKHQPPLPFPLQENSALTQNVFKGFIVVWPAHVMLEASLEVLKVVDKVLHVSSRL